MRHLQPAPTNPGASSSVTLFDNGAIVSANVIKHSSKVARVRVAIYTNVSDLHLVTEWAPVDGTTLREVSNVTVSATTFTQRDILLQPGRTKISIVTTTNPTTWDVGYELVDGHQLAQ
jgi:hypothetical protein